MHFKFVLGVDMGKDTFTYTLLNEFYEIVCEGEVNNEEAQILSFIAMLLEKYIDSMDEVILVMEHTGIYVNLLARCWTIKEGKLSLVVANQVSSLLAGDHGWAEKTDQLDARRLAEYGFRYSDRLKLWQAKSETLEALKCLHRLRTRLINALNLLKVPSQESQKFDNAELSDLLIQSQTESIEALEKNIKEADKKMETLIKNDEQLRQLFKLITSVSGVGPAIARELIITTEAFERFTPDQPKQFSRYAGVVPLKRESGRKKAKAKTSKRANKKVKTLLTMGARSLIGTKNELGLYYARKINEGKTHLCVINAIRNKLILRVFAVVRNQTMYQKNLNII